MEPSKFTEPASEAAAPPRPRAVCFPRSARWGPPPRYPRRPVHPRGAACIGACGARTGVALLGSGARRRPPWPPGLRGWDRAPRPPPPSPLPPRARAAAARPGSLRVPSEWTIHYVSAEVRFVPSLILRYHRSLPTSSFYYNFGSLLVFRGKFGAASFYRFCYFISVFSLGLSLLFFFSQKGGGRGVLLVFRERGWSRVR